MGGGQVIPVYTGDSPLPIQEGTGQETMRQQEQPKFFQLNLVM
jgi:hypothetical protein